MHEHKSFTTLPRYLRLRLATSYLNRTCIYCSNPTLLSYAGELLNLDKRWRCFKLLRCSLIGLVEFDETHFSEFVKIQVIIYDMNRIHTVTSTFIYFSIVLSRYFTY